MNPGNGVAALRFPHAAPPDPGTAIEVAPGVRWLRMPLPFALNHINLWLVDDGAGWAIVDTGINSLPTKELWERIFADHLDGRPVTRLIVTHFHPDHMGLAGWLTERLKIELWTTAGEWDHAHRALADAPGTFGNELIDYYRRIGFRAADETAATGRPTSYRLLVSPVPERFHALADGMAVTIGERSWRVIIGRGHAPDHACLYCPALNLLIAGDQVLPKISPNVSLWPRATDQDPLGSYLASLAKLKAAVPSGTFTLPSHNLPFYGLHTRIEQLEQLHDQRIGIVVDACGEPRTAKELVPILFERKLDKHQLGFAIGETMAHVAHAVALGRLARTDGADGAWRFRKT